MEELVRFNLNRDRNHERLSESTMFSRIEIPTSLDPLNGDILDNLLIYYFLGAEIACSL